jgi:hypothetical protein
VLATVKATVHAHAITIRFIIAMVEILSILRQVCRTLKSSAVRSPRDSRPW